MELNLPPAVRAALYTLITLGSPLVIYLQVTERIGEPEVTLWLGLTAAVSLLARLNVTFKK